MSLLLDKNLFIVTSALVPNIGVIQPQDRFNQTIDTLKSLRKQLPNDYIFFSDGSPNAVPKEWEDEISKYANAMALWAQDPEIKQLASAGQKSQSEIVLLFKTLQALKGNPQLHPIMQDTKRIFKFSARSILHDSFDIKEYDNLFGKYVFKTRIPSWLSQDKQKQTTDNLFITRMYSMCPSLIDDYLQTLVKCYNSTNDHGIDTEHAHYQHIDKKYLIEFDKLHCEGIMAGTGATEVY